MVDQEIVPNLLGNQLAVDFEQLIRNNSDFNTFMIKYIEFLKNHQRNIITTNIEIKNINRKFIENGNLLLILENLDDFVNIDLNNEDKPVFEKTDEELLEIGYKILKFIMKWLI